MHARTRALTHVLASIAGHVFASDGKGVPASRPESRPWPRRRLRPCHGVVAARRPDRPQATGPRSAIAMHPQFAAQWAGISACRRARCAPCRDCGRPRECASPLPSSSIGRSTIEAPSPALQALRACPARPLAGTRVQRVVHRRPDSRLESHRSFRSSHLVRRQSSAGHLAMFAVNAEIARRGRAPRPSLKSVAPKGAMSL